MQLAHAGRKGSTSQPWKGNKPLTPQQGGFLPIYAPSAVPFYDGHVPEALDEGGIARIVRAFGDAASRALNAGFRVLEIHAAHGYLLHEFLSPLANRRTDQYGGSFDNRARAILEVARAVRAKWPERLPMFTRISSTDWAEGGWDVEQSIELARRLAREGVDLIDCSSGGMAPGAKIPVGPGYQTQFAERIRLEAGIPTGASGAHPLALPGRAHPAQRTGRYGHPRPRNAAQSVLAAGGRA